MTKIAIPRALQAQGINGYSQEAQSRKLAFHKAAQTFLSNLATALGFEKSAYDLRSNMAGVAVSGEITLHADHLYVQLSESCMGPGVQMMYRACRSRKDYCGLRNNFVQLATFADESRQEQVVNQMRALFLEGQQAA